MRFLVLVMRLVAIGVVASLTVGTSLAQPVSATSLVSASSSEEDVKRMAKKIVRKAGKYVKLGWNCKETGTRYRGYAYSYTNKKGRLAYKICLRSGMSRSITRWVAYHEVAHIKMFKLRRAEGLTTEELSSFLAKGFNYKRLLNSRTRLQPVDVDEVVADCVAADRTKSLKHASYVKKCSKKARKIARSIWRFELP